MDGPVNSDLPKMASEGLTTAYDLHRVQSTACTSAQKTEFPQKRWFPSSAENRTCVASITALTDGGGAIVERYAYDSLRVSAVESIDRSRV